jgi:pimeloyl-ACP methyl ester carboxylesterase
LTGICLSAVAAKRNRHFLTPCLILLGVFSAVSSLAQPDARAQREAQANPSSSNITFRLKDHPQAKSVTLAGTFNNWNTQSTPMARKGADWSVSINLAPGTYGYKFVVDTNRWTIDPENPDTADDGEGHINSVVVVATGGKQFNTGTNTSGLNRTSFHQRLNVGDHKLYINCEGRLRKGVPVVVMDSGMGNSSESWLGIQPKVAEFARVCIYDRAGLGNSDPITHKQTSRQIAADLHTLLTRAGVGQPLVLVGHSFGGISVRMYASMYPRQVVGMVLVDSTHEEQFIRTDALIPEAIKKQFPPDAFVPIGPENLDWDETVEQTRKANWHANIPLIVLTAANARPDPPGLLAYLAPKFEEIRQELQRDLVHRSALGKQIVATKSGHFIHHDEPELVVSAIREVVNETRKHK